jgi:hypothetical protein
MTLLKLVIGAEVEAPKEEHSLMSRDSPGNLTIRHKIRHFHLRFEPMNEPPLLPRSSAASVRGNPHVLKNNYTFCAY